MTREDELQKVLMYLTLAEDWVMENRQGLDSIPERQLQYLAVPLTHFNGAEIVEGDFHINAKSYTTWVFNPFAEENRELMTMDIGLWKHALITFPDEDAPVHEKATCLYHIGKYEKLALKDVRGRFKLHTGDFVEWSHAWVYNDGTFETSRAIWERRGRENWVAVGQPYPCEEEPPEEDTTRAIFFAKSMAFSRYYDWRVELGFEMPGQSSLPTIAVPTDPIGARTAYRLRDIPPGKSRRDALRHWVSTHFRKSAHDPDEQIRIWAHLRGVEEFAHNGLRCRIVPSAYDLKKAAEYQRLRKEEKANVHRKIS